MTAFGLLFRLNVWHNYYAGQPVPLKLVPYALSDRMCAAADMRFRMTEGCVDVICASDRNALTGWAGQKPLNFRFKMMAADANLPFVTAKLADPLPAGRVPVLDAGQAEAEFGQVVGTRDFGAHPGLLPIGLVRVRVDPNAQNARFNLRLAAREMPWIYHVIGGRTGTGLSIRDPASNVAFTRLDTQTTPGGRKARSFISDAPVALSARAPQRFELIEDGRFGPKVVLPILPVPQPGPTTEIYITLP